MKKIILMGPILFLVLSILGCNSRVADVPSESAEVTVTATPMFFEPFLIFTAATVLLGISLVAATGVWKNQRQITSASIYWWLHFIFIVLPVALATLFSALAATFISPVMMGLSEPGMSYTIAEYFVISSICLLTLGLIVRGGSALCLLIRSIIRKRQVGK